MSAPIYLTQEQFLAKANSVHNNRYDYPRAIYKSAHEKIIITCKIHGDFLQTPGSHLYGRGCRKCAATSSIQDFIRKAQEVHGDRYDYSITKFDGCYSKVKIICRIHGSFEQSTSNHMNGSGCRKCRSNISKMCDAWLDNLGLPDDNEHREVILPIHTRVNGKRKYIADGYDPQTNTVYEFWGDFWHGNLSKYSGEHYNNVSKRTMAQLNEQTLMKATKIREAGFNLVEMWESDWITMNKRNI